MQNLRTNDNQIQYYSNNNVDVNQASARETHAVALTSTDPAVIIQEVQEVHNYHPPQNNSVTNHSGLEVYRQQFEGMYWNCNAGNF